MGFFAFPYINDLTPPVESLAYWRDLISFANKLCKQTLCSCVDWAHYLKALFSFRVLPPEVWSGQKVNLSFSLVLITKH